MVSPSMADHVLLVLMCAMSIIVIKEASRKQRSLYLYICHSFLSNRLLFVSNVDEHVNMYD